MNSKKVLVSLFLAGAISISATGCAIVQPGEVGVKASLGSIKDQPLAPGMHVAMPLVDNVSIFDTRTVALPEEFKDALTKDGQSVVVNGTATFNINSSKVVSIYSQVGINNDAVKDKIIVPTLKAVVRDVASQYTMQEIYENQPKIAAEISQKVTANLASNDFVTLTSFNITGFKLDEQVQNAIEQRQIANQKLQQKDTELEIAKKEAQRLEILKKSISSETLMQDAISKWDGTGIPPTLSGGNFLLQAPSIPNKKAQ